MDEPDPLEEPPEDPPPPELPPPELDPDELEPPPPEELEDPPLLELLLELVAIFIMLDLTAMSMTLVICGEDMDFVTSVSISFLKVGLERVISTAFSNTLCPAGVIKACCSCVEEMVSAIIFCIFGVSISSRTAFCTSMEGELPEELEPPDELDPLDPPEEPPPLDPPELPPLEPPEDPPLP